VNDGEEPLPTGRPRRSARVGRWSLPAVWVTLPFTTGPCFAAALAPTAPAFRSACSVGLWLMWAAVLVAVLVPRTVTLTAVRIAAPAALVATGWAAIATPSVSAKDAVALGFSALAAAVAFAPATGDAFVNGSAYGLERRLPLRAPAAVLLGPIELAWAATVAGLTAGPLLLADRAWVAGAFALVLGWPLAWWAARSLHVLSRRWLVFTPAGLVLHDQLALAEAALVLRRQLRSVGPALADTEARDLTMGALGLALEVELTEPLAITPAPRRRLGTQDAVASEDVSALLFTPTRPGRVLAEAAARRLPVV
jgi:hypothetical protein